jgi:Ca2+-binding RTX toxin-like protein
MTHIIGSDAEDNLVGAAEDDVFVAGAGADTLDGGGGSDTYLVGRFEGFDSYRDSGAAGVDVVVAAYHDIAIGLDGFGPASGIEEISAGGFTGVSVRGGGGDDLLDFSGTRLAGVVAIEDDGGNDTIIGSAADDVIRAGHGADRVNGADGSDTYLVGAGQGFDTYADTGTSGVDRILAAGHEVGIGVSGFGPRSGVEEISANGHLGVTLRGDRGDDLLDFSTTTLVGISAIEDDGGADTIVGSAGHDVIRSGAGDDRLLAGAGSDTLDGGEGADTYLVGRYEGFDRYVDTGRSGYDRILAVGHDTAIGLADFDASSGIEEISGQGFVGVSLRGGAGDDVLDFSATRLLDVALIEDDGGADTIIGSSGDDVIRAGVGSDRLDGGGGSDVYLVGRHHGYDDYRDSGEGGVDVIRATSVEMAIGVRSGFGATSGVEVIDAGGHAGVSLVGDAGDDVLDFSAIDLRGVAMIDGAAGADTLTGSAGHDVLSGGDGADIFRFVVPAEAADRISDFRSGQDRIDLGSLEASLSLGGAGGANSVTWRHADGDTWIEIEVTGDAQVDLVIVLSGIHELSAGDFLL